MGSRHISIFMLLLIVQGTGNNATVIIFKVTDFRCTIAVVVSPARHINEAEKEDEKAYESGNQQIPDAEPKNCVEIDVHMTEALKPPFCLIFLYIVDLNGLAVLSL